MSNETNATELSVYEMMSKANAAFEAKDYATALPLYEKAAEQGDATAQFNLGIMYENGKGIAQDYSRACDWYEKAAEQGDAYAQNNLGIMYENGDGVAQDYDKAREWYEKAAENGCEEAKQVLSDWENKGANNSKA